MQKKRFSTLLFVGVSILLLEGILVASFFAFWGGVFPQEEQAEQKEAEDALLSSQPEKSEPMVLDRLGEVRSGLIANKTEFLEINFSKNKVFKYENGKAVQEQTILAKGDPQGWGGTPAGLYKTLAKHESAFSGISQVYMPSAIHFYGKYYLHGEPYYLWGEKLASDVSGGCIRLQDSGAEAIYDSIEKDIPIFVVDKENDGYSYEEVYASPLPLISAQSYLVADVDSGFVFAEKNSQNVMPIASITKLMTALVVAENVDLRKSIEVTEAMLEAYGTTEGLQEGERYRVVELFYPLLIASSNDAAEATAGFLGRARTIEMMNEKAEAMILADTVFVDPSGFDPGNVSSAQDLFYLARYILNNRPPLFEITKGKEVRSFGQVRFSLEDLGNKNIFTADSSFAGGKTGYITASKHTGVFLFRFVGELKEVRTIAFVVLGAQNDKVDVQRLYSWLLRNYQLSPDYSS